MRNFLCGLIIIVPALLQGGLSGTYVIGNQGGADYNTFTQAASALQSQGVSGPVTFNVLSGTYNEYFTLSNISGTSATNTVTFQKYASSTGDVTLSNTTSSSSYNYIIRLNGPDYVTFKNITFDRSVTTGSYGSIIRFDTGTSYITIDSCVFKGVDTNSSSSSYGIIYSYNYSQYNGVKIKNSTFTNGGNYAISLTASSSSPPTGLEITNNTFTNTYSG
ncbi:uncharacterized protein METZ01_LOCUS454112, partial [marine metagenome]